MGEINGPNFGINQVNFSGIQKQEPETPSDVVENAEPKIKDFGNPKAEALGRSMLVKDADNINHDLKVIIEHPQVAENSDEIFETSFKALQDADVENPYEEAASFSTGNI